MAPSVSGAVLKLQYPHRFVQNGTCTYNPSSLASGTLTARMEEEDEDGLSAIRKCIFGYAEPGRISLRPPSVNPASWPRSNKCFVGYAERGRILLRPPSVNPASRHPLQ